MDGRAYRAVTGLFVNYKQRKAAEIMGQKALEILTEDESVERFKTHTVMSEILMRRGRPKQAYKHVEEFLKYLEKEDIAEEIGKPFQLTAFTLKARVEVKLGRKEDAAKSFSEAKAVFPDKLISGDVLTEEIDLYTGEEGDNVDKESYIATLKRWSPLERITWMAWKWDDEADERHEVIRDVAALTGEIDFFRGIYEEAIKYLDNVNAGAPLRIMLALFHWHVCEDYESARKTLDEVLDSSSTGWPYAVTDESPDWTLEKAINNQADVLFHLFRKSSDPKVKMEILESAKGLVTRPLPLDVPPQAETFLVYYHLSVTQMYFKMGPAMEFQKMLQKIIDSCMDGLTDKVGWNDAPHLILLAKALHILSLAVPSMAVELRRASEIFSSARFNKLTSTPMADDDDDDDDEEDEDEDEDDESDSESEEGSEEDDGEEGEGDEGDEDEGSENADESGQDNEAGITVEDNIPPEEDGDIMDHDGGWTCDGTCQPVTCFGWWAGRVGYQCWTCDSFVCQPCYEKRMAADKGDQTAMPGRKFCGEGHDLTKCPIEGWRGVKDGKIRMEGEEDVEFGQYLGKVREEIVKKAWESFWIGA